MRHRRRLDKAQGSLTSFTGHPRPAAPTQTIMRTLSACLLLTVLVACSSNPPAQTAGDVQTVRVSGPGGGELRIRGSDDVNLVIVSDSMARVWSILPSVYDSLGLSLDPALMDSRRRILSSGTIKVRRKIGETSLSRYLDCGQSTQIGPNADTYDVMLSVTTTLQSQPAGATGISTTVEAAGKPINFSQGYSACKSTGRLEKAIGDVARAKLKR
jgi:hypothetical protein